MRSTTSVVASCLVASLALLAASVPVSAAPKRITGELSEPRYTVIALAANGKATAVQATDGEFALRPPAGRVTLHLRAPNGRYAGPIVIGRDGKRAVVGVRAGARLGEVEIVVRGRYAKLANSVPERFLDRSRTAKARNGVPVGARAFGRVRSRANGASGLGRDRDLDGLPGALDVDDDGDLIFDSLERSRPVRSAGAEPDGFSFGLILFAEIPLNANAAGVTVQQIDALLSTHGGFEEMVVSGGGDAELDCGGTPDPADPAGWIGGLEYCTRGGSGRIPPRPPGPGPPRSAWPRFPDAFDPDGDGLGSLTGATEVLSHGATSSEIATGDVLIARVTKGGVETHFPATLQYVPLTTPAPVSYSDGQGNSRTVSYPIPHPDPVTGIGANQPCETGTNCSGPGTRGNPFPVKAGTNGDVVLTFTFWRPQRARLPNDPSPGAGDSSAWTDIGGLRYGASAGTSECWPEDFSTTDPNLVIVDPGERERGGEPNEGHGLQDRATDTPANPTNTFTYTLNATKCIAHGESSPPETWNVGDVKGVGSSSFAPSAGSGASGVGVFFRRVE